ncbi:DEAD/DEAH box helicase [Anaerorhabdus sp.]|uniref:DEAD/DEAH box helicase n=1 Tax=Anaerorhabdus sp. TaxID=1872524 RepID=UPI002FC81AB7
MNTQFKEYNLDKRIIQAILDCGYLSCTEIQRQSLPLLLEGKNCLIQSKTGSGKTAAFCIPLIEAIDFDDPTSALILAPTRELAQQIQHEFNRLAIYKKINCVCLIGRQDFQKQALQLKQKAHVIVGTPGRVFDHLESNNINMDNIKTLILDEANEMVTLGLLEQVETIVADLPEHKTWLFSATMDSELLLSKLNVNDANIITIDSPLEISNQIDTYHIKTNDKENVLLDICTHCKIESMCVFVNTREDTKKITMLLQKQKYLCSILHGGMEQKERTQSLAKFKQGKTRILVSTDIAARGIDVDQITTVVHYDCPLTIDSYIHRSGRTGRKDEQGTSITLISKDDTSSIKNQILDETEAFIIPSETVDNHLNKSVHKEDKDSTFNSKNTHLFIRAGKKDKIRNLDVVGALCSLEQFNSDNIGIIDIQQNYTTVTLLNIDQSQIEDLQAVKIKGKNRKVELKIK